MWVVYTSCCTQLWTSSSFIICMWLWHICVSYLFCILRSFGQSLALKSALGCDGPAPGTLSGQYENCFAKFVWRLHMLVIVYVCFTLSVSSVSVCHCNCKAGSGFRICTWLWWAASRNFVSPILLHTGSLTPVYNDDHDCFEFWTLEW